MNPSVEKTIREGNCRVCTKMDIETAHLVPRSLNPKMEHWTNPDETVPLCKRCHAAFDHGELELLPYLTLDEQVAAVRAAGGIERARARLTCG